MIKKMGNVPEKLNHWNDIFKNNVLNKAKELNEYQNKLTQTVCNKHLVFQHQFQQNLAKLL